MKYSISDQAPDYKGDIFVHEMTSVVTRHFEWTHLSSVCQCQSSCLQSPKHSSQFSPRARPSMELLLLLLSLPGLLPLKCGQVGEHLEPGTQTSSLDRVVNGQTASPHSIPWQAYLFTLSRVTQGTTLLAMIMELTALSLEMTSGGGCGGSLISNFYAQCVTNINKDLEKKFGIFGILWLFQINGQL